MRLYLQALVLGLVVAGLLSFIGLWTDFLPLWLP